MMEFSVKIQKMIILEFSLGSIPTPDVIFKKNVFKVLMLNKYTIPSVKNCSKRYLRY